MKKIHRVLLVLLLVTFLLTSFAIPTFAAVAIRGDDQFSYYPPVQIEIDWGMFEPTPLTGAPLSEITYRGTYYDTLGVPTYGATGGFGSVETVSTLSPSGDGKVLMQLNNYRSEYVNDEFHSSWLHYRYLLQQGVRDCVFTELRVNAYDFYLLPCSMEDENNFNLGFYIMLQNLPSDLDVTYEIIAEIRNIGEDDYETFTKRYYDSDLIAFDVDDLDDEYFNQTTGDFLGCYVKSLTARCWRNQPFTWNDQSFDGHWAGYFEPDNRNYQSVQLEFDYLFTSYDAAAYQEVLERDEVPPEIDNSMYYKDYTSWVSEAVGGFFDFNVFPGFSLGGIVITVMSFAIAIWLLKMFAGG